MKLTDILLFILAITFFVFGIYESMITSIAQAYLHFMVSIAALFLYGYRKKNSERQDTTKTNKKK